MNIFDSLKPYLEQRLSQFRDMKDLNMCTLRTNFTCTCVCTHDHTCDLPAGCCRASACGRDEGCMDPMFNILKCV